MTQTNEAHDIASAKYALQLNVCVFYLIYLNKGRWEWYPSPGTVPLKTQ